MRFLMGMVVAAVAFFVGFFLYVTYWDAVIQPFFSSESSGVAVYVGDVPFSVTIADTPESRKQGLSNTPPLDQFKGKLFIFDEPAKHGFWMKDMNYAIDILWFDENFTLVHIEESVTPATYPRIFAPPVPALYVLEVSADTVNSLKISLGETLVVPSGVVPIGRTLDLQ